MAALAAGIQPIRGVEFVDAWNTPTKYRFRISDANADM